MSTRAQAVVIGASAGAVEALSAILPNLPADYPLPVLIVVHLPPQRKSILAELFNSKCALNVREAEDKEPILPGNIYFAPANYHLQVEQSRTISLSVDDEVHFSRPSIDVLFETASDTYGAALIGVILSGANEDGASGLAVIAGAGGTALIQNPHEAYMAAMPMAALIQTPTAHALCLAELSHFLHESAYAHETH